MRESLPLASHNASHTLRLMYSLPQGTGLHGFFLHRFRKTNACLSVHTPQHMDEKGTLAFTTCEGLWPGPAAFARQSTWLRSAHKSL